jgi:enoyl-CoA hydratase
MAFETITVAETDGVGVITLNRPERLNAINRRMLDELARALDALAAADAVRAVVLTGAGKAFSSGFDLKEQMAARPEGTEVWRDILAHDFAGVMRFWSFPKPTIAAVRGHCLAGGCELALACDVTIAASDAVFGEPELKFGAGIVVMLLPWLTGPKQAKELILSGADDIPAERALALGLINRIVPVGEELAAALAFARKLAVVDPNLVRQTKRAINRAYEIMGMGRALEEALAIDLEIEGPGSPDKRQFMEIARRDGLKAALAWREARFRR